MRRKAGWHLSLLFCLVLLVVGLRLCALGSDPYVRLDWSAGLLTDEGFYVHNARNVVLFGQTRTDEFNNYLLAPLLHYTQTAVFLLFGAGAIPARSISVICSLVTLLLLYAALRRALDNRIALTAVLFLGLDHTNLLYNRMALMDTPAAMLAVAAFYAFIRGVEKDEPSVHTQKSWLLACGVLLGLTVVGRMLCTYLLPVPFLALMWGRGKGDDERRREGHGSWLLVTAGLTVVLAAYLLFWYLPHRAEITPMNQYYRTHQIQPRSIRHLGENLQHAIVGDFRGLAPYLFRHTPVLFALILLGGVGYWVKGVGNGQTVQNNPPAASPVERYLWAWLLLGWGLLAVISYSPSRYYITTYPALASLAALSLWRLPDLWDRLWSKERSVRWVRGAVAAYLVFHLVLTFVHYGKVLPRIPTMLLLYGLPLVAGVIALGMKWEAPSGTRLGKRIPGYLIPVTLTLWLCINAGWLMDWGRQIRYSQHDLSAWLAQNLPGGSVLIGDVAPGVSLDNPYKVVHVQPGLCNGVTPVEKQAGSPRYIVILDGRWKEPYWIQTYPGLVAPNRRLKLSRVLRWDVGVYAVDTPDLSSVPPG